MKKYFSIFLRASLVFSLVIVTSLSSLSFLQPERVKAQSTLGGKVWIIDRLVDSISVSANAGTVFVGGDFESIGPYTGHGIPLETSNGQPVMSFPKINEGAVLTSTSDGQSGWYIGGTFSKVGNFARNKIAHIFENGNVDPSWDPNIAGESVNSLFLDSTKNILFVGGQFTSVGTVERKNLAAINTNSGQATFWNPNVSGDSGDFKASVNTLIMDKNASNVTYNDIIYVGGRFTSVGGQPRNNIAAIDTGTAGALSSWNPNISGNEASSSVKAMVLRFPYKTIYVGGQFTSVGGQPRDNIAAIDTDSGMALFQNLEVDGPVYALASDVECSSATTNQCTSYRNLVYVGGAFSSIGGQEIHNIAAVDTGSGTVLSWSESSNGPVYVLIPDLSKNLVYVGGAFSSIGGQEIHNIAAIDANTSKVVSWNIGADRDVRTLSLNLAKNRIYAGGEFDYIKTKIRRKIAAFNTHTGELTDWDPNSNLGAPPITLSGSKKLVYIEDKLVSSSTEAKFAAINTETGLATDWNIGTNDPIVSLVLNQKKNVIYVGDNFIGFISPSDHASPPAPPAVPATPNVSEPTPPVVKFIFSNNLGFGMIGDGVRELQKYLNKNGFSLAFSGPGSFGNETTYFGRLTKAALIKFQDVNKSQLGILQGTGYFGPLTRSLINK